MAPSPLVHWRVVKAAAKAAATAVLLGGTSLALQDSTETTAKLTVTAVRHWSLSDTTRVAIEVSGEFEYRHDRLSGPDRLYFDIVGAQSAINKQQQVLTIPVGDKLLKQIRVSNMRPGVTRVVLDLGQPVDFTAAQLANPDRLLIELHSQGSRQAVTPSSAEPRREAPAGPVPAAVVAAQPPAPPATPEPAQATPEPVDDRVPLPAKRTDTGAQSLVRALGLKLERVVLDPGHGGHDTGTIGPTGLMEKELVLDIAQRLGTLIEGRLGAEVVYTRTDDTFVPLEQRTALANEKKADLFLSIHANAGVAAVVGPETYYLNFTTVKSAMDVAARENASSERSIHELQDLIEKIALKDKVQESRDFADKLQTALVKELVRGDARSRNRGVRQAPFVVLVGAAMPSALAEVDFLSNRREEALLKRPGYRQRIAAALFQGISQYASSLSRFQVADTKAP